MADTKSLIIQSEWWLDDSEAESTQINPRSNLHSTLCWGHRNFLPNDIHVTLTSYIENGFQVTSETVLQTIQNSPFFQL